MKIEEPGFWQQELEAFENATRSFYKGELPIHQYKSISGLYGSYSQRGGKLAMLRLRMTAGRVTREKMKFVADVIRRFHIEKIHFTTCQTIQLHDLNPDEVCTIIKEAFSYGIITMGGGGDYPRNVMCSPLSGVEKEEYFNVLPYAEAVGDYLMTFIKKEKLPRKLKVAFSNTPQNLTHATYRDLGFAARENGRFDVYSAGGLGKSPLLGIKTAENIPPEKILYYVKAMWLTFRAYGNYESRAKSRTRFMVEALGGEENYRKAFQEKLGEVINSGENLDITLPPDFPAKKGDGSTISHPRAISQKKEGLYAVHWHPIGGMPSAEVLCRLCDLLAEIPGAEMRLSPDESVYLINLTGTEAQKILELTEHSAETPFEASVSCIGASICQIGLRDSQALLAKCVQAVREAGLPGNALPKIHISGCPSSCGTHQTGVLGFRGAGKFIDGKSEPAFLLYINGYEREGAEAFGHEAGTLLQEDIPVFLVELGRQVAASGMDFDTWFAKNPGAVEKAAEKYTK